MQLYTLLASAIVNGLLAASAIVPVTSKDVGFIELDFDKVNATELADDHPLRKRDVYTDSLINKETYYITWIEIGSDKQKLGVDVDTGSADLWVPFVGAVGTNGIYEFGSYDPSTSSTSQRLQDPFQISYLDGTKISGHFYQDTLKLSESSATITSFQFAVADQLTMGYGVFGIGNNLHLWASVKYPNFIDVLKDQGLIRQRAYSIYLDLPKAEKGKVIFGGIDLAKIDGPLVDLPIIDEKLLGVNMDSVTVNGETITVNQKAMFDSGTTLVAFTPEVAKFVMLHYDNAQYHPEANVWTVDSDKNKDQIIELNFNGVTVPFTLTRAYFPNFLKNGIDYGKVFRVRQFEFNLLGDIFLSNAYCVFNYDTNIVSLGLARHTTESNIVAI